MPNKIKRVIKMKSYMLMLGIISIFLISACSQQAEPPQTGSQPKVISAGEKTAESFPAAAETSAPGESGNAEGKAAAPDLNVKEFSMVARQWEFVPSQIRVKEGDKVVLNIKNGDVAHGFAIFEFNVNERLQAGEAKTIEFTADKKGEYVFFCSVPCGKGHKDMKGRLIVE